MKTICIKNSWLIDDITLELSAGHKMGVGLISLLSLFLFSGALLQALDPTAAVLDIGILSVLLFGLLATVCLIFCNLWLQEILWKPFRSFRHKFAHHFNHLTAFEQCIIYFLVFFLGLYACLWTLAIVL